MKRKSEWEDSGDTCPRCAQETEYAIGLDDEGNEIIEAERCARCRWVVRFFDDREHEVEIGGGA